jgi:FkbM family methyltransferase
MAEDKEPRETEAPRDSKAPAQKGIDRRSVLVGALGGVVTGGAAGFLAGSEGQKAKDRESARTAASAAPAPPRPSPRGDAGVPKAKNVSESARPSFAQQGEDLVMQAMVYDVAKILVPTYIDIGAFEPIFSNNTYLFYATGGHGVLVEPNPTYTAKLRAERPRDVVLEIGVGITDEAEADYYLFEESEGQLNTFSKEQADKLRAKGAKPPKVIKRKLVKVNEILEEHFKDRAPDIFSIDVEGLDLDILKTMDFERWRPLVICTETSELNTGRLEQETIDFLATKQYQARGGSFVNTIFLDQRPRPTKK